MSATEITSVMALVFVVLVALAVAVEYAGQTEGMFRLVAVAALGGGYLLALPYYPATQLAGSILAGVAVTIASALVSGGRS